MDELYVIQRNGTGEFLRYDSTSTKFNWTKDIRLTKIFNSRIEAQRWYSFYESILPLSHFFIGLEE